MASILLFSWSILLFVTGLYGESLIMEEYSKSNANTSCKEGLIADVDKYNFTLKITAEKETFDERTLLVFYLQPKGFNWTTIVCWIYFQTVPQCDKMKPGDKCYCNGYSKGVFEVVLYKTAEMYESEGSVFAMWANNFPKMQTYSNKASLPVIYDKAIEILHAGRKYVKPKEKCYLSLSVGDIIDWCVTHLVGPTLTIALSPEIVTQKSNCVKLIVTPKTPSRGHFNASYQEQGGCMRSAVYTCNYDRSNIYGPLMSKNGCQTPSLSFGWISFMMIGFYVGNRIRMSSN